MTGLALPRDALTSVVRTLPDNGPALDRQAAAERFLQRGFPSTRIEDWKYTDLVPVADLSRRWLEAGALQPNTGQAASHIEAICASIDAHWVVILNGELQPCGSTPESVSLTSLKAVDTLPAHDDALADLNTALLGDGLHIHVAGTTLKRPLGVLCFDLGDDSPHVTQTRVNIEVDPGAAIELIEYHASIGETDHYANALLDISLGESASATHVRIQDRHRRHAQTHRSSARLAGRSRLRYSGFDLGGRLIRNDLHVHLTGQDAEADIGGLYVAGDDQHIDNHIRVDHIVGPARSAQEYRGILGANCRCVWNGKAIVRAGADGTDAEQGNHNLLLSDRAEIDAKPELEIYADEVKCSHGTTVGQLDENALFYMRTRGLDERQARNALTQAFGASIVSRIKCDALAELLSGKVDARLNDMVRGEVS